MRAGTLRGRCVRARYAADACGHATRHGRAFGGRFCMRGSELDLVGSCYGASVCFGGEAGLGCGSSEVCREPPAVLRVVGLVWVADLGFVEQVLHPLS